MKHESLQDFLSSDSDNILGIWVNRTVDEIGKTHLRDKILYFWSNGSFMLTMIFSDFQKEKYKVFLEYLDIQTEKKYFVNLFLFKNTSLEDFREEVLNGEIFYRQAKSIS